MLGLGHLAGTLVPQLTEKHPRQGLQAFPFHPPNSTQLLTAWMAVDSWGPSGGLLCRVPPPTGQEPGGAGENSQAPSLAQPRLLAHSVLVYICVSVMSLCSFYMCCRCSLSPCTPAVLCNPNFPSSRHPSSSQELEKPLSGARPLPPPTIPGCLPCPALPYILPSVQSDGLAGRSH